MGRNRGLSPIVEFCLVRNFAVLWSEIDIRAAFWRLGVPQIVILAPG